MQLGLETMGLWWQHLPHQCNRLLAVVMEEIRDIDKGMVTMVMPASKLNRERAEERNMADRFGELEV